MDLPEIWLELTAHQRDILLTLDAHGPCSGAALHSRVGGYNHSQSPSSTYRNLDGLLSREFVTQSQRDGRENEYAITQAGERAVVAFLDGVCE